MQKSEPPRFSMNNNILKRSLAYIAGLSIRILKLFVPIKSLWNKLKVLQDICYRHSYNFISAQEYIDKFRVNTDTYFLDGIKVFVFSDFYVTVNETSVESYIHDKRKNILIESGASYVNRNVPTILINFPKTKLIDIDEAVDLALMNNYNYWHFSFTALDKIMAFEENGYKGKYIVPNIKYIRELLALTNIPMEKFIFTDGTKCTFRVKKLHVLEYSYKGDSTSFSNPEIMHKIRDLVLSNIDLSDISSYPKRIFVKRIGVRKIKNESEVENYLNRYGFKTIVPEDYSVEEQIKYFYAADIVFCAHGANSTNALYMRPNTHFIESFGVKYVNPCILDIIKVNKLNYNMIVENLSSPNTKKNIEGCSANYNVDLKHLDSVLYNLV